MMTPATASAATASKRPSQRNSEPHAEPRARDAQNDHERAPHVGGEVQRVGFERLAGIFLARRGAGRATEEVDSHAEGQDDDGRQGSGRMCTALKSSR